MATDPEFMAAIVEGKTELDAVRDIPAYEVAAEFLNRS